MSTTIITDTPSLRELTVSKRIVGENVGKKEKATGK
jgi:hypothetical protein